MATNRQAFANNCSGTLASSITDSDTTITLTTGHGANFPVAVTNGVSNSYFYTTLADSSGNIEVVKCTVHNPSSDSFSCTRGQDDTVARAWAAGDLFELRLNAAALDDMQEVMNATSGQATGIDHISFATSSSQPCIQTSSTGSTRKIIYNSGTNSQYSLGTSPYVEFKTSLGFYDNTSSDPGIFCAAISPSGISTTGTVSTSVLSVIGNSTLGNGTSDTVAVAGYFDGTTSFGTSAWPTTNLGKTNARVLIGNEGVLTLWNETASVGGAATMYLGTKHSTISTGFGGGSIKGGTSSTDYSGFLSLSTYTAAGSLTEALRIDSVGDRIVTKATSQYTSGNDGYTIVSGGSSSVLGAAIVLFGESHATAANELHLRNAGNTTRVKLDTNGNLLQVSTGGIGYGTGSGGTVTQATSRTTGVTLNKTNGAITLVSAAGSTSWQSFTLTNSTIAATDVVIVNQKSGTDKYMIHVTAVAAGSCQITFATTSGTTTEQPVFNFAVIKGVTS